jgi:phage tail sheath protein FI
MPFQVSPGVNVSEIDLTTVIPAVSTSVGGFAGKFRWGPLEEITLMNSEVGLASLFGEPDSNTAVDFYTAANFLSYSNALQVVRVANSTIYNAQELAPHTGGTQIKNDSSFELQHGTLANTFYAKYAGALGNDITVELCDHAGATGGGGYVDWAYKAYFDNAPGTSDHATLTGGSGDEVHVAIIDSPTGTFSGVANSVLEVWPALSKATDVRNSSGDVIYFKTFLNNKSRYIRIGSPTAKTTATYGLPSTGQAFTNVASGVHSIRLSNGSDGPKYVAAGDYTAAYDLLADPETTDVSLLIAGEGGRVGLTDGTAADEDSRETVIKHVIDMATSRKDAVAFFSPLKSDTADLATAALMHTQVLDFRETQTNKNTSYAFMDSGWKYQYDKYTDVYRWIPLNGDIAGLAARTDKNRDAWWSPAGYNRGQIKNVVRLAFNPNKAQRDALYSKQINPVVTFPGQGTILFGDKTQQTKPSAFDRVNVRRLFIVLEKAVSTAAKFSLFEFNDEFTRAQFRNMVEPFLRDVKGRRGITDFRVVCDETNNPGSVIDRNEFVGDIYIKPSRSINFIQLNFVAVSTGVDFSEVVGKF